MSFDKIRERASVEAAIAEFDRIGREAFLAKYGFAKARDYYLVVDGRRYDSKAIVGAAHGYEFPDLGPLPAGRFYGGAATVRPKLESMGFVVEGPPAETHTGESNRLLSQLLHAGSAYTREELSRILETDDATINTGVFRPKGFDSVLLFVTEKKTPDRTQYVDRLDGDELHWQGQSKGRTDALVIEHLQRGLELLLFYRTEKYEHPGAGFRYEGLFDYVSHHGALPASFVLRRANTEAMVGQQTRIVSPATAEFNEVVSEAETTGAFNPENLEDARKRTMAAIVRRQGQPAFRRALLQAYGGRCAITGCDVLQVLEAAHIVPYQGPATNHVTNGLLLRADLHTLFDLGLISICPESKSMVVSPALRSMEYGVLHGQAVRLPSNPVDHPSEHVLRQHYLRSGFDL